MNKYLILCLLFSTLLRAQSGSVTHTSDHLPWGGYWWSMEKGQNALGWYSQTHPDRDIFTVNEVKIFDECLTVFSYECNSILEEMAGFEGRRLSPLMKYDYFVRRTLGPDVESIFFTHAAKREIDIHYIGGNPDHPLYENRGFAGKCIGWALSTIDYKEPLKDTLVNGILFTPADIKALLAVKYNAAQLFVGDRFVGNSYLMSTHDDFKEEYYEDVTPKQLLIGFEKTINKGRILEADLDPDFGVWNYPVFKYDFNWTQEANEVNGEITIFYMNDEVGLDDVFSIEDLLIEDREDVKTRSYTFRLIVNGRFSGASEQVISSRWIGQSMDNHPDTLILGTESYWDENIADYDDADNTEFNFEVFKEDFLNSIINSYDPKLKTI